MTNIYVRALNTPTGPIGLAAAGSNHLQRHDAFMAVWLPTRADWHPADRDTPGLASLRWQHVERAFRATRSVRVLP